MKKLNIKFLLNIFLTLPLLAQATVTKPNIAKVLKKEGIKLQGNSKNWKLDLQIDQVEGTISKSKAGIWYKNSNYSIYTPFNSKFGMKYYSKNGKTFVFTKDNAKSYFVSSKPYHKGSHGKEITSRYDNQIFLTSDDWCGVQLVQLSNGILIDRGVRHEMSISIILPNKGGIKSHPRNQLRVWPNSDFTLFKNGKVIAQSFHKSQ